MGDDDGGYVGVLTDASHAPAPIPLGLRGGAARLTGRAGRHHGAGVAPARRAVPLLLRNRHQRRRQADHVVALIALVT